MARFLTLGAFVLLVAPPLLGCQPANNNGPPPQPMTPYGQYPQQYPQQPYPYGAPNGVPPGNPMPPPNAGPPATTQGPSAQPFDATAAAAAAGPIMMDAKLDAPGMSTEGPPLAGTFQEGQVLEQPITINPGRCYTFIAAGIGVQEIEIQLVGQSPIPALTPMMGDTKGTGGKAVLGRGTGCIKLAVIPMAVPAKWVIKASHGGGVISGQAFSK